MNVIYRHIILVFFVFGNFVYYNTASAELIFTAPPRETAQAGQKLYGPLAAYLSSLWGQKVTYKHPQDWLQYQRDMRDDKYDIDFDAAHFISWRMHHLNATPLLRLPGHTYFVIVAHSNDNTINKTSDLIGKPICGIPPPNLGTLTIFSQFPNPARQPIIYRIKGGFIKSFKAFMAGHCDAVVLRSNIYNNKLTDADRKAMKIIFKSTPLPKQGITVSQRITPGQQRQMLKALTETPAGIAATRPILRRFAGNAKAMIPATKQEYMDARNYLEGVIFGW